MSSRLSTCVIDASIAVKWTIPEEWSDAARRWLDLNALLRGPDLLVLEAANVLVKYCRRNVLSIDGAAEAIVALTRLVAVTPSAPLVHSAFSLATAHQISVYDATYVALALEEDCPFVTADRRLLNALLPVFPETMLWVDDVPETTET